MQEQTQGYNNLGKPSPELVAAIEKIWQYLKETNSKLQNQKAESEKSVQLKNEFEAMFHDTQAKLSSINKNYEDLRDTYSSLKVNYQGLQQKVKAIPELNEKLQQMADRMNYLSEQNAALKKDNEKIDELEKTLGFVQKEVARKNHELKQKEDDLLSKRNIISELESKVISLRGRSAADANKDNGIATELEKEIAELKIQLEIQKSNAKEQEAKFTKELNRYKELWEAQEQTLSQYSVQLLDLSKQKTEIEKKKDEASDIVNNMYAELQIKNDEIKALNEKIEQSENTHKEALNAADEKIIKLSKEFAAEKEKSVNLSSELSSLESKYKLEALDKIKQLEDTISEKDNIIDIYNKRIKGFSEHKKSLEESITNLKAEIYKREDQKNELLNKIKAENSKITDQLQHNLLAKSNEADELRYELELLNEETAKNDRETENLKTHTAELEAAVMNLENDKDNLIVEMEKLRETSVAAKAKAEKINMLENQLQAAQNELLIKDSKQKKTADEILEWQTRADELRAKAEDINSELKDLEDKYLKSEIKAEDLEKELSEAKISKELLDEQIHDLNTELKDKNIIIDGFEQKVLQWQKESRQKDELIEQLREQLNNGNGSNDAKKDELINKIDGYISKLGSYIES